MGDPGQGTGDQRRIGARNARGQCGVSLIELLGTLAVSSVVLLMSLLLSNDWIRREAGRSAVYQVQSHLQLARAHAITRSHDTRFVIDEASRRITIFDLNDPGDATDDLQLAEVSLSRTIEFDRPDPGSAITLDPYGGTLYEATFAPEGSVDNGVGAIHIETAGTFHRVSLYAAGGVEVWHWDGSSWAKGS